jgi:leukotriene-A4 hydrolase
MRDVAFWSGLQVCLATYLICIAAGKLVRRELGPRSAVWSEEELVDKAAYEFADTERFIEAGENTCGPYVWGRYDILLLPPSFPCMWCGLAIGGCDRRH